VTSELPKTGILELDETGQLGPEYPKYLVARECSEA